MFIFVFVLNYCIELFVKILFGSKTLYLGFSGAVWPRGMGGAWGTGRD